MKQFLTLAVLCISVSFAFAQHGVESSSETTSETMSDSPSINWLSFEEAFELHQKEPKKWVVDIWTTWCGWCKRMDATSFKDSLIIDQINGEFYAVKLDGEYKKDIVLGDQTYHFVDEGRRGYHELPAQLMGGKMSYPTYVFLDEGLQILTAVPGYKLAKEFLPILEFVALYDKETNAITYADFIESYVSPYPTEEEN